VKIIVGQAAGSASDIVAASDRPIPVGKLGQQFLVEVRPGAAGNIATEPRSTCRPTATPVCSINSQNAYQRRRSTRS